MRILGISALQRNSAAALAVDGEIVAAIEEERFTRKRGEAGFPVRAARFCLERAGLTSADLDQVVFYEKPLRRFERTLLCQVAAFPSSARCFASEMFLWLGDRLWLRGRIAEELGIDPARVGFSSRHQAQAAAAFLPSPFDEAAGLGVDGGGE
jgi:carbamoyltransferase